MQSPNILGSYKAILIGLILTGMFVLPVWAGSSKPKKKTQPNVDSLSVGDLEALVRVQCGRVYGWHKHTFSKREAWGKKKVSADGSVKPRDLILKWAKRGTFSVVVDANLQCNSVPIFFNVPMGRAMEAVLRSCRWEFMDMKLGSKPKVYRLMTHATFEKIRKARLESIIHKPIKIRLIPTLYRKPETLAPILKKYVLSPKGWAVSIPGINILLVSDYVPFLIRAEGLVRSVDISKEDLKKDILKNHMPHRKP